MVIAVESATERFATTFNTYAYSLIQIVGVNGDIGSEPKILFMIVITPIIYIIAQLIPVIYVLNQIGV